LWACWTIGTYIFLIHSIHSDVATYVLIALKKDVPVDDSAEAKELIQQARNNDTVTARLAVDLSQKNPFYSVAYDDPIAQVVIGLFNL
jgi:hypothetical protein